MVDVVLERPPRPELRGHVASVWVEEARPDGRQVRSRVVADGYVDLVYGRSLWVRGPDTRAHPIRYGPASRFVGIRFRPGAAQAVLGTPMSELVDRRVFLRELWGDCADELAEQLAGLPADDVAEALEAAVVPRLVPPDPLIERVVAELERETRSSVRGLAERLGSSERQLLRRSRSALGYGPKTFQRILRLRRFLRLVRGTAPTGLAQLAFTAGYADQAHLSRECRLLTGDVPSAFLP